MTLASSPITVYSTQAEFNAAFDLRTLSAPAVCSYPYPWRDFWCCAGCDQWCPSSTWRFYPKLDGLAYCPHCAELVDLEKTS